MSPAHPAELSLRVRSCALPPHVKPHDDHAVQSETTQPSVGHGPEGQSWVCVAGPQVLPPCLAGVDQRLRWRTDVLLPHVSEHADHAPHGLSTQSIGHGTLPQNRDSTETPHGLPPYPAATMT